MATSYFNLLAKKQLCQELTKDLTAHKSARQKLVAPSIEYTAIQGVLDEQDKLIKELQSNIEKSTLPTYKPDLEYFQLENDLVEKCKNAREQLARFEEASLQKLNKNFDALIVQGMTQTQIDDNNKLRNQMIEAFRNQNKQFIDLMEKHAGKPTGTPSEQKGELKASLDKVKDLMVGGDLEDFNKKSQRKELVAALQKVKASSTADLRVIAASGENPLENLNDVMKEYLKTDDAKSIKAKIKNNGDDASYLQRSVMNINPLTIGKEMIGHWAFNNEKKFNDENFDEALEFVKKVKGFDPKAKFTQKYDQELYKGQDLVARIEAGDNELDILFGLIRGTLYSKLPNDRIFVAAAVYEDEGKIKEKIGSDMKAEMKDIMAKCDESIKNNPTQREQLLKNRDEKLDECAQKYADIAMKEKIVLPKTGYPPEGVSPHLVRDLHKDAENKIRQTRPQVINNLIREVKAESRNELDKANVNTPRITMGS